MSLINSIAAWYLKKRIYQIEMFIKHPVETQMEVFHKLINTAANTAFGKKHGFPSIQSVADFQARVPVSSYEELHPFIERVLEGDEDVIWPGATKWFSKSSGTTNAKSKFIPVSKEALDDCHFKGGKDMLAIYLHNNPESELFTGRGLPIGGSHEVNQLSSGSYYGDLSAVLIENTPDVFNLFRATSKKVSLMGEWESKIQAIADQVLNLNVTSIAGVPTWTLVLIHKLFEMSGTGTRNLKDIWPGLEVFFHGGVSFKPYRKQFDDLIPPGEINYVETYNASEGFFGIQNESAKDDMLLMLDYGIFYEFIRLEDLGNPFPKALTIEEVQPDVTYAMIISTNAGLWRYLIGDTVRFSSTSPFKLRIVGRTQQFMNAFGEELMVDNADRALAFACNQTGASVEDYTAAPVYFSGNDGGAHEWLIEFKHRPLNMEEFREHFDNELKRLNSDYEAKRHKSIALKGPVIVDLPKGTFYEWMRMRGKLGGQNKVPRLANHRDYVESIHAMLGIHA